MPSSTTIRDAVKAHWAERLPAPIVPYAQLMRLDRPIGWWLLLLPCWWGWRWRQLAQARRPTRAPALLFLIGAIVMRGAGCDVNDLVDRDIDAKVERTRNAAAALGPGRRCGRPWSSSRAHAARRPGRAAQLQPARRSHSASPRWCIVAIYPFMKRITCVAAGCARPCLQLGRADGLGRDHGRTRPAGLPALCRRHLLDAGLRHDLRPPGQATTTR